MLCPQCHIDLDSDFRACPECGAQIYRRVSGVMKTTAVMISADGEDGFYESVRDVPEGLRRRLMESTASENAGTIIIADRGGKEQLTQVLSRRQAARRNSSARRTSERERSESEDNSAEAREALEHIALADSAAPAPGPRISRQRLKTLAWIGFFTVLAAGAAFAAFFGMRF
jgi:hypothetical protein